MAKKNTTTTATTTATATDSKKKTMVEVGKDLQKKAAELTQFDKDLQDAQKALSLALSWKIKLSTHFVTLKDEKTRKYIKVDSGMPRDVSVILVEGKDHNIAVKFLSVDARYTNQNMTEGETSYNKMIDAWTKVCGKEATSRINEIIKSVKGFDDLWAYVVLLERNAEIAKSEKFAQFFN